MKLRSVAMLSALLLSATALPALADTNETVDKAKAAVTPGEFVLTGHEVKTIHSGKGVRSYRVCVKAEKDSAPMKVTADGKDETLQPGDCKEIAGKKIVATAAQSLSGSAHIVATFHHEKGTKLSQQSEKK